MLGGGGRQRDRKEKKDDYKDVESLLPSLDIPTARHFLKRQC